MSQGASSRPAYKIEDLLALRGSASESAVSLEKFPDEDVIKEHVLKASVSNPGLSTARENMRPPGGMNNASRTLAAMTMRPHPLLTGTAIKRPSPTPSVKRHKAERLLKEHGSPPNVRVTAGGRIVPTDFTPLGSPRFSVPQMHRAHPPSMQFQHRSILNPLRAGNQLPNGYVGYDLDGNLCQWVDSKWLSVQVSPSGQLALYMPPPNWPFPPLGHQAVQSPGQGHPVVMLPPAVPVSQFPNTVPLPQQFTTDIAQPAMHMDNRNVDAQIDALHAEYTQLRQFKIEYERNEVKLGDGLSQTQHADIVEQKRRFVIGLDGIRKRIKELNATKYPGSSTAFTGAGSSGRFSTPACIDATEGMAPSPFMPTFPATHRPCAMSVVDRNNGLDWRLMQQAVEPIAPLVPSSAEEVHHQSPHSEPSSTSVVPSRHSHAIEIKDPKTHRPVADHTASNLNPTSPSYEPGKPFPLTEGSPPQFVVPAPTPIDTPDVPPAELAKHWVFINDSNQSTFGNMEPARGSDSRSPDEMAMDPHDNHQSQAMARYDTNHSSVTTTDFFPTNTHDHSFSKYMQRNTPGGANRVQDGPSTPQHKLQNRFISPASEQQQRNVRAPPVSPIVPVDYRMSSFLRDTAQFDMSMPEECYRNDQIQTLPPLSKKISDEFKDKTDAYLRGYIAGTRRKQPMHLNDPEYLQGYTDGTRERLAQKDSRSTSTVSLESATSHTLSNEPSKMQTPPNTTTVNNRVTSGSGLYHENLRMTQSQSATYLPPHRAHFGQEQFRAETSTSNEYQTASLLPKDNEISRYNRSSIRTNFAPLDRAISDYRSHNKSPSNGEASGTTWDTRTVPASFTAQTKEAIIVGSAPVRRERIMSANYTQSSSLTGYAGNRHEIAARVSSVPHQSVFGEDKYGFSPNTAPFGGVKIDSGFTNRPNRSSKNRSTNSQLDGAMDDLVELVEKVDVSTVSSTPKYQDVSKPTVNPAKIQRAGFTGGSSGGNQTRSPADPISTPRYPPETHTTPSPTSSPIKSNYSCSPKKLSSPKHRIQQLARGFIGTSGSDRSDRSTTQTGSSNINGTRRSESPDPKKMSPEEKRCWKEDWRHRFLHMKDREVADIKKYKKENPM